jgi:hypothetical protein
MSGLQSRLSYLLQNVKIEHRFRKPFNSFIYEGEGIDLNHLTGIDHPLTLSEEIQNHRLEIC